MGRSIGTGPAIACSVRHPDVAGLIVMSAFTSISDMVDKVAGNFVGIFVSNRFPSIDIIGQVRCPVLFLHGKADEIIPHTHSERLFAACSSSRFLCIRENMTHNRFILEKDVLEPIANFFDFAGDAMPLWELDPMIFIHPSKRGTSLVPIFNFCIGRIPY
jgi:pimeloyl-ACP methyl ester carboxylesterase